MYTLKLISENTEHDTDYLIEQDEKTGKKNYKIKGIFMQADIKNRNGRIYPMEILQKHSLSELNQTTHIALMEK